MMERNIIGYSSLALAASCWGAMYVVGKFVMGYISPFFTLWLRFFIAFIILFFISFVIKKERLTKTDLPFIALLGFLGYFISSGAAFVGTYLSSAQLGALIAATPPIFTVFLATWILKEKLTMKNFFSMLLALLGLFLVVGIRLEHQQGKYMFGVVFLIIGAMAWALYTIFIKKVKYSSIFISTYATGFGILFTTPVMMWQFRKEDLFHLLNINLSVSILFLGIISTALAFFLWNKGMEYIDAGVGSIFTFFNVIVGGLLGWIFLKESLEWNFFIGTFFILIAMVIILLKDQLPDSEDILE